VKAPFSLFLALRYLKPKRTFVSMITLISVLGVTLGIAVLIVVISVMSGYRQKLRETVLGFEPHLLVNNRGVLADWRPLDKTMRETPGVLATAPFAQGPVLATFKGQVVTPILRGIDREREEQVTPIRECLKFGSFDLENDGAVIGSDLASNLDIGIGGKIIVHSPRNFEEVAQKFSQAGDGKPDAKTLEEIREMVVPQELTVTGIFESGRQMYDSGFILVALHVAQELYGLGDGLHGISVRTTDPDRAGEIKQRLEAALPPDIEAPTWMDRNRQIFAAVALERDVMFFLLVFIVIVAAFGVMNTLITVTVQKTREIGILKALGATTGQIIWVFLAQGMVVGVFGNVSGVALGLACVHWRNEFKDWLAWVRNEEVFSPDVYQFSQIPADVQTPDVVLICVTAFCMCAVAALIPAYLAARLDPVAALRRE
jgi:lipoprotein-releasing system permease protein